MKSNKELINANSVNGFSVMEQWHILTHSVCE